MKNATINCMTISNQYDARKWNASTDRRTKQIISGRTRRIKRLFIHAALKGIGAGILAAACVIEPAYGNIAVNLLYGIIGVGLVVLG